MKILLSGGGTGGHIMPALAVARSIKDKMPKAKLLFVGSTKPAEKELVESAGLQFKAISSGKIRRYFDLQNVIDIFRVFRGVAQARRIVREFAPDVVFAKGGYASYPMVVAAGSMGIPVVAHESDMRVGLSNRLGFKYMKKLATSFPVAEVKKNSTKVIAESNKLVETGLPIQQQLLSVVAKKPFANGRPTLMITGGSQGASYINQVVAEVLRDLLPVVNIVHYTGTRDFEVINSVYQALGDEFNGKWMVKDFDTQDFHGLLKGSDLVLSRAGSTVFELEVLAKPVILVPLPGSAGNHQLLNARYLDKQGGAVMIEQDKFNSESLVKIIKKLVANPAQMKQMAGRMKEMGQVHIKAADMIADLVLAEVKNG